MATTKTFNNVRLQLKYDTITNWTTANPVLLAGEIAITSVPAANGDVKQAPAVLMKVGDGVTAYNDLKFVSGLAANVHNWALAETKPEYAATEITGLADFISGEIQDTNTSYQVVKVDEYTYKLQSKEIGEDTWTDVVNNTIVIPKYDDAAVKADIATLQGLVGSKAVATQITEAIAALDLANTYEAKGAAATALTNAKAYTDALANGAVKTNTDAITGIKNGTQFNDFAAIEGELTRIEGAATDAADQALADAKAYADGKDAAIAAAKSAADAAQGEVDALELKVGTVPEGKDVVTMIAEAQDAATYDDTALAGRVTATEGRLDTIEADYLKAADKTELTNADSAMAGRLDTLEGQITGLSGAMHFRGVETELPADVTGYVDGDVIIVGEKEYVFNAGAFVEFGDVSAEGGRITALEGRMTTAEGDIDAVEARVTTAEGEIDALQADTHTHDNKALLDTYTQTEANLADAVAKKHEHLNAAVLDGIKDTDVTNWNDAKAKADTIGVVTEGKTVVEMIADAQAAATYDDTAITGRVTAVEGRATALEGRADALEANAVLDGDTLILNCGNSVIA